ncbi:MAG TPA: amidase family protein [Vicinamibacteria bacterium]|nr:amidase family protein [Vicinamibacteria bacterium]
MELGAALGGGLLAGDPGRVAEAASAAGTRPWFELSIAELQALMASGPLTSWWLTLAYLVRIVQLNPSLGAVIEYDVGALSTANALDQERQSGHVRGPLHGIPVLVKDNIAIAGTLQTTAGSLALVGSTVPGDAALVTRLRAAGAVIVGKANLSEWAGFRGLSSPAGWSARGGFTRNPYLLGATPGGSSSGSAVAAAAGLCTAAVGTETNGSIVGPAGDNMVVGVKPTVGLVSQSGLIPIGASQDTAGPLARTVMDAAILLGALQSPFGAVAGQPLPADYTTFLRRGALAGARIGVDRRYFDPAYGGEADITNVVEQALDVMEGLGATVVDTDTGDPVALYVPEITLILYEFKVGIGAYLAGLVRTPVRTLDDLIAFDRANCAAEMRYFGQEYFEAADATSGDLTDPAYLAARAECLQLARTQGIDAALERDQLDAIVAPCNTLASTPAAVAGYPSLSVPCGRTAQGLPVGLWIYGGFLQEPKLLALAYDFEQEVQARVVPGLLGSPPQPPPDAGLCGVAPARTAGGQILYLGNGKALPPSWPPPPAVER